MLHTINPTENTKGVEVRIAGVTQTDRRIDREMDGNKQIDG